MKPCDICGKERKLSYLKLEQPRPLDFESILKMPSDDVDGVWLCETCLAAVQKLGIRQEGTRD